MLPLNATGTTSIGIAVIGSGPMPALVAGLLAAEHGRSVCLVSHPFSPLRVQRGLDLGAAVMTRPESWALLRALVPETVRLVGRIAGRATVIRTDPLFVAESVAGIEALSHMRHMAAASGMEVKRSDRAGPAGQPAGFRLSDVPVLSRALLGPALGVWLDGLGVRRLDSRETRIELAVDGGVVIASAQQDLLAEELVLADDEAILDVLGEAGLPALLRHETATAMLTEPSRPLPAPVLLDADSGAVLWQQGEGIAALAMGPPEAASRRLGAALRPQLPLRRAGEASFSMLATIDGAPVVGRLEGSRTTVLAGLGPIGALLAPALARAIVGCGQGAEAAWFRARAPGGPRLGVADWNGAAEGSVGA